LLKEDLGENPLKDFIGLNVIEDIISDRNMV